MQRLVIVSNRLPFTCKRGHGGYHFTPSSGGLVTALSAYLEEKKQDPDFSCVWVGWPGATVEADQQAIVREQALREFNALPVFLPEEEMKQFYLGFCNRTLWPLCHYFPSFISYDPAFWETYRRVNERFRDALLAELQPGDRVWIHDYQLLLLPGMLREQKPDLCLGFFLHIPFPSFELFRLLPNHWRRELLLGMLGADLIGFHTQDYTQYFLRCVYRTLGFDHHLGQIQVDEQIRRADTFPIGIDFARFEAAALSPEVEAACADLRAEMKGRRVVFSVDRLDYTKGIVQRLEGFEEFLLRHPEWLGEVTFIMTVVPSREEVPHYRKMKQELDEIVGRINGRNGRLDWVPILYHYGHLDFQELTALYRLADVALITPLRDGMNLVSKEYLACQVEEKGVLILSEMTGAARELGEAVLVNPNHRGDLADAIQEAISMPEDERIRRNRPMRERLRLYDARRWADSFLDALERRYSQRDLFATQRLTASLSEEIWAGRRRSRRPILLLDYDGTLVPFAPLPHLAEPDAELLDLLTRLSRPPNTVYIVSGRSRSVLDGWLGKLPLGRIAEHGAWLHPPGGEWRQLKPTTPAWKDKLRPIFQTYVDRLPGSLIEEKEFSLAWHYRKADPEIGMLRAKELVDDLMHYTANFEVQVLEGKKVVELRQSGVHKGAAVLDVLRGSNFDFIFAAGDDQTDEDMFRSLPPEAVTVRVGWRFSAARYSLRGPAEMRRFLHGFAA